MDFFSLDEHRTLISEQCNIRTLFNLMSVNKSFYSEILYIFENKPVPISLITFYKCRSETYFEILIPSDKARMNFSTYGNAIVIDIQRTINQIKKYVKKKICTTQINIPDLCEIFSIPGFNIARVSDRPEIYLGKGKLFPENNNPLNRLTAYSLIEIDESIDQVHADKCYSCEKYIQRNITVEPSFCISSIYCSMMCMDSRCTDVMSRL